MMNIGIDPAAPGGDVSSNYLFDAETRKWSVVDQKPVLVPASVSANDANKQYGEAYGIDWVYDTSDTGAPEAGDVPGLAKAGDPNYASEPNLALFPDDHVQPAGEYPADDRPPSYVDTLISHAEAVMLSAHAEVSELVDEAERGVAGAGAAIVRKTHELWGALHPLVADNAIPRTLEACRALPLEISSTWNEVEGLVIQEFMDVNDVIYKVVMNEHGCYVKVPK